MSFIVSMWVEGQAAAAEWRGYVETAGGRRLYFRTLAELNRVLSEAGGWRDPAPANQPGAGAPASTG